MAKQIDTQHVVNEQQRIADVRPWGVKMQEKLSEPSNFLFFMGSLFLAAYSVPALLPIVIVLFLLAHGSVMSIKNLLPYRYPSHKGIDPATQKKANGIMYVGAVRSDSPYEKFKQCWLSDSDLRKHWLIMGSTGSGKSETLKGIFYNTLCWGSGFFCADGKADNKLPTDGYTMARAFGRDDDILALNFLLGGKTPQQVARSRRRRSNRLNPFSSGDADTLIQMGANLLPKAEGDGKSWQEKALVVWRAVITALCYKRDTADYTMSVGGIIDYLSLSMIEELYVEGYREAENSEDKSWSYGFSSIKNYLESGLPAYSVEKLLKKHSLGDNAAAAPATGARRPPANGRDTEQDPAALEQHGYRAGQLMPVLNLLDKTYGYIFKAPFSEIDMIDVALHNRILFLLIPSLEKSSQEAENLGKLSIACLRVMMARNLGSELEGSREELLESKATQAPYPYVVALDELGYYFADGIAVMFAQARSLGISMMAAAQDLEKLTEGSRKAEAGAMIGNTVNKIFMKIDDPEQTWKLVSSTVGKVNVANYESFEAGKGAGGYKRDKRVSIRESDMITYQEMQKYTEGQAVMNALGVTRRISTFFMGDWLDKLNNKNFHLNRFLQVGAPTVEDVTRYCVQVKRAKDERAINNGSDLLAILRGVQPLPAIESNEIFNTLASMVSLIDANYRDIGAMERGVLLYLGLRQLIHGERANQIEQESYGTIPASAQLLGSSSAMGIAQALDEHGLPDPFALVRKPIQSILEKPEETPIREPLVEITGGGFHKSLHNFDEDDPSQYKPDYFGSDPLADEDPLDDILIKGRKSAQTSGSAPWVGKAIADAHKMREEPRSVDDTAVGVGDDGLSALAALEQELGSPRPKESAYAMQKVVSAQVTPDTIGRGFLTEDEIDSFFAASMGGDAGLDGSDGKSASGND